MASTWVGLSPVLLLSPWDAGPWCTDPTTTCSPPPIHTHQADKLVSFGPSARQNQTAGLRSVFSLPASKGW